MITFVFSKYSLFSEEVGFGNVHFTLKPRNGYPCFPFVAGRDIVHSTGRVHLLISTNYKQSMIATLLATVSHTLFFVSLCRIFASLRRPSDKRVFKQRVFNIGRKMKSLKGAFALGLLPTTAIAQNVVTISLPTCVPGGGTGILSGSAPTGPTTEVIDVTATNSLGSVTVEPITEVVTPGASAT